MALEMAAGEVNEQEIEKEVVDHRTEDEEQLDPGSTEEERRKPMRDAAKTDKKCGSSGGWQRCRAARVWRGRMCNTRRKRVCTKMVEESKNRRAVWPERQREAKPQGEA